VPFGMTPPCTGRHFAHGTNAVATRGFGHFPPIHRLVALDNGMETSWDNEFKGLGTLVAPLPKKYTWRLRDLARGGALRQLSLANGEGCCVESVRVSCPDPTQNRYVNTACPWARARLPQLDHRAQATARISPPPCGSGLWRATKV